MKKCFLSERGPKAIGPYSTCVLDADSAYLSGMLGVDPATGALAPGGAREQAAQALENIKTVLGELGLGMEHALKTTVYLSDMGDFKQVNEVYARYFGPDYPARSCVQVSALPMGGLVEIEVIATLKV